MTEGTISLPALYLREIGGVVGDYGVDVDKWLNALGICLPEDGEEFLDLSLPIFRRMVVEGKTLTDPASFSLQVGQRLLINSHGMLGYAAMNSGSLRQLTELIEQFLLLRTDLFTLSHETVDGEFRVAFHEIDGLCEARPWVLEAVVLAVKNIYDFTSMGECPVSYAAFAIDHPPNAKRIRTFFKCDVHFQLPWTGFALPEHAMDRPLKMANPGGFARATKLCLQEFNAKHGQQRLSDRVKRMLLNSVGNIPSLETTAYSFNLTPRTMHRQLLREGTSYKALLDDTRRTLAVHYLEERDVSVQEIAFMLGYADIANFRRAFKRWEGVPPREFRNRPQRSRTGER